MRSSPPVITRLCRANVSESQAMRFVDTWRDDPSRYQRRAERRERLCRTAYFVEQKLRIRRHQASACSKVVSVPYAN